MPGWRAGTLPHGRGLIIAGHKEPTLGASANDDNVASVSARQTGLLGGAPAMNF